jgi:hypothetical protein
VRAISNVGGKYGASVAPTCLSALEGPNGLVCQAAIIKTKETQQRNWVKQNETVAIFTVFKALMRIANEQMRSLTRNSFWFTCVDNSCDVPCECLLPRRFFVGGGTETKPQGVEIISTESLEQRLECSCSC